MITTHYKAAFDWLLAPLARLLVAARVSPTVLTLTGPLLMAACCVFLLVTNRVLAFCALVMVASLLDGLDGAVARAGGRVTKVGAYLDAVCDRYSEGLIILTVAAVTGTWLLSGVVLLGALLVSYTKARAAMEVAISNQEWPDLMERMERGVCYLVGLAASRLLPSWRPLGHDLFWWTLGILAVLIHATVLQRMLRARRLILLRDS